jgi:quercetin dioxygenase-like cupin family protein
MKTAAFLDEVIFDDHKVLIKVLLETDFTKEIRIAMKAGQEMKEHKAPLPIVVQVLQGEISFGVKGKRLILNEGNIIALEASVPHDLLAKSDSIVRLTLSNGDQVDRVQKVID